MSQKKEGSADKWRDLAKKEGISESEEALQSAEKPVDDAHLLQDEGADNTARDKITLLEKQIDAYRDQVARSRAEVENMHRRMEQEVSKARKFGVERIILEILPVVDSLVRGLEGGDSADPAIQAMRKGMTLTLDMLHKLLEKNGIVAIVPKAGDAFDPAQHEAMSMRPEPNMKSNTIVQVLQKGYALHGRVLRAAMVIVSA